MTTTAVPSYQHTQYALWFVLLYAIGILMLVVGWLVYADSPIVIVLMVAGGVMLLIGTCFQHLSVSDEGDGLRIRFGPLPLFQRRVPYQDIQSVEAGRTLMLDGWGIHLSLRGGWVWNLSGRDCVVIHLRQGVLRVGTDDREHLAEFLKTKISPSSRP